MQFSTEAGAMNEPALPDLSRGPARPETLTVEFYEQTDTLVIHKRSGGGPWIILLLWLIGWTVGCVALVVKVLTEPTPGMVVFALPFWAAWLFVASQVVWMRFGKETLLLDRDAAVFQRTAWIRLAARIVPREEIQEFRECRSSYTENDEYLWGIEMITLGKPVRFAFRLPDRERAWLLHQLNRFLRTSGPVEERHVLQPTKLSPRTSFGGTADANGTPVATEVLAFESTLAGPPADCRWHLAEGPDTFAFWQRGRLHLGAFAGLLFVNAFWNGIVSVFVMTLFGLMPINNPPQGWQWWGTFVFLVPFEVIGLAMVAGLVLVVLEPFRRTEWRFERDRIVRQTRWPVWRLKRAWDVPDLDRLELRRGNRNDSRRQRSSGLTTDLSGEDPFDLAFVSRDIIDLCTITNLTEGEARWMARFVFDRCPAWFR
jgi:hypothetical protein